MTIDTKRLDVLVEELDASDAITTEDDAFAFVDHLDVYASMLAAATGVAPKFGKGSRLKQCADELRKRKPRIERRRKLLTTLAKRAAKMQDSVTEYFGEQMLESDVEQIEEDREQLIKLLLDLVEELRGDDE